MGWVIGSLLGLIALELAIRLLAAYKFGGFLDHRPPFNVRPAVPDPDAEEVWFPTTDGLTLRGSLYRHEERPSRGLIIFCPEMLGSRWSALDYCSGLYDAGFDILAFDFRNQGESDSLLGYEPLHWVTEYEVQDVLAAIAFSRSRDGLRDLPLGLFGISRGGGAALAAAARCRDVRCVASEGAFTIESMMLHYTFRWGVLYIPEWLLSKIPLWHVRQTLALVRWISQAKRGCRYAAIDRLLPRLRGRPVLLIAGGRDTYVDPVLTEEMQRRIGGPQAQLWIVPQARHNLARDVESQEYDRRLVELFSHLNVAAPVDAVRQPG